MTATRNILWYGRGGQGAFSAAKLLGAAYALSREDAYALAFPSFGPERRGAPVCAYTKLSSAPINNRSADEHPNHVVCLDETLLEDLASQTIQAGGALICVSDEVKEFSARVLGREIVNTTLLALLCLELGDISEQDLVSGIEETLPARIQTKNIELVKAVYAAPEGLRESAVRIITAPTPLPHQRNQVVGGAEYMNLLTADGFTKPHVVYQPGNGGGSK